jgi:GT2 family glycosyltransferase
MIPLNVYCCSMGGNVENINFLRPIIDGLGMKLVVISEWDEHDIKWNLKTWLTELNKADIVVCAYRDSQPAKSANRVTQAQYLGKPVCASSHLQAAREAIVDGETGFLCDSPLKWEERLRLLRDDPSLRNKMGQTAKLSAQKLYSIDTVGSFWLHALSRLAKESCNPPHCDIIIPTWNNLRLLQECINSIKVNTDWPHNIIVVNSGNDGTKEWLSQQANIVTYNHPERLHFSAANNAGLRLSKSPYVCLLNDDTIVAQYWLSALMHEALKPDIGAVNPFSNCDKGWLHNEQWISDGVDLHPAMILNEVERVIPSIYQHRHPKVVTNRQWLPFFCTVLKREAINKAGLFDENFKSGDEDLDMCLRIGKCGYRFVTTFDSVVFHFGGSTRKNAEKFSYETHHREDQENHDYFMGKHPDFKPNQQPVSQQETEDVAYFKKQLLTSFYIPKTKPLFVMFTGQGWEKWSPKNIDIGGIGGSETCAVYVCREFARRGYRTILYGDPGSDVGVYDGVEYKPWEQFDPAQPMDILMSSRRPDLFQLPVNARKKICYVHDIWVHPDPKSYIWADKIDKFFVLSPWHQEFFCKHHNIPVEKTYLTRNAIDLSRFSQSMPRVRGRMVYSSSPDRGLDVLLDCLPRIRARVPEAHLKIFYGMDNLLKASKIRNNPHELAWIDNLERKLKQPGVEYVGRVGQKQLAHEFLQAELWAYPTYFSETSCLTAMEVMAAGTPVVTSNLAALSTTVGADGGVIIDGDSKSELYQRNFVEVCCYVLLNRNVWEELSQRGKNKVINSRWDLVVDEWIKELA